MIQVEGDDVWIWSRLLSSDIKDRAIVWSIVDIRPERRKAVTLFPWSGYVRGEQSILGQAVSLRVGSENNIRIVHQSRTAHLASRIGRTNTHADSSRRHGAGEVQILSSGVEFQVSTDKGEHQAIADSSMGQ
jgi:hypothetical protein